MIGWRLVVGVGIGDEDVFILVTSVFEESRVAIRAADRVGVGWVIDALGNC